MSLNELMHTGFPVMAPLVAVLVIVWIIDNKAKRKRLNR